MITDLISYNINSKNRVSGTSHDFYINLELPKEKLNNLDYVSLVSLCFPKSFYQVSENNNNFTYIEENLTTNQIYNYNIILDIGNYSKKEIFNKIKNKLENASLNNIIFNITDEYTDRETGKIKIEASNSNILKKFIFNINDIYQIMGFQKGETYSFIDIIYSPLVINLNHEDNILIHCDMICSENNDYKNNSNDILTTIFTSGNKNFSYIVKDYDIITNMKPFKNKNLIHIFITNEDNDIINLNNVDLSMVLCFFNYTNNRDMYNQINNYIKFRLLTNDK
jgi:hypothetical protein